MDKIDYCFRELKIIIKNIFDMFFVLFLGVIIFLYVRFNVLLIFCELFWYCKRLICFLIFLLFKSFFVNVLNFRSIVVLVLNGIKVI